MSRLVAALRLSDAGAGPPTPLPGVPRRTVVLGDPQASRAALFGLLDHHQLLGADGRLVPDAALLSIGDHFDFGADPVHAAAEGERFLGWLASHDARQVLLLAGNHDLVRVAEFATISDLRFAEARSAALHLRAADEADRPALEAAFRDRFPEVPTPGLVARDFSAFRESQRVLVQDLLLSRRLRLAAAADVHGRRALLTHAGVTTRELALLGLGPTAAPDVIAAALNAWLDAAVDRVEPAWRRGIPAALELGPLHVAGAPGREGGGLLYHRPARPERGAHDGAWERDPARPRRFDPRTLPPRVLQVCGHSSHAKCLVELEGWVGGSARAASSGRLRTLLSDGRDVSYRAGVHLPGPDEAALVMLDPSLARLAPGSEVELLAVSALATP
jgi:hypothetical protein